MRRLLRLKLMMLHRLVNGGLLVNDSRLLVIRCFLPRPLLPLKSRLRLRSRRLHGHPPPESLVLQFLW